MRPLLLFALAAFALATAVPSSVAAQAIAPAGAMAESAWRRDVIPLASPRRTRETPADYIIGTAALGAALGGLSGMVYGVVDCRRREGCRGSGLGEMGAALLHGIEWMVWGAGGGAVGGLVWYAIDVRRGVVWVTVRPGARGLTWR